MTEQRPSAGVAGMALGGVPGTAAAADGETPSWLHTDGRWVRNAEGESGRLRGIATTSMGFYEVESTHPKTLSEVVGWASDADRGWYPNVVRLPVIQWDVNQLGVDGLVDDMLRPMVDMLGDRGIHALIDSHIVHPYMAAADDDAGYDTSPDEIVRNFWGGVAPAFAADEHVIYEPTYPMFWSDTGETVEFEALDCISEDRWITGLEWDRGDGETAEGWWASHSYESAGTTSSHATDNTDHSTTHEADITVEESEE